MHTANSIVMNAPKPRIFEVAADLEKWPNFLPHYRYIQYLDRGAKAGSSATRRSEAERRRTCRAEAGPSRTRRSEAQRRRMHETSRGDRSGTGNANRRR